MPTSNNQTGRQSVTTQSKRKSKKITADIKTVDKEKNKRRNTYITAVSIFLVISIIIGIAYYLIYVMPFQRVIIKVDEDAVKINYFLKRALNNTSEDPIGQSFFDTLVFELIVLQEAPKYGINVSEQDIDTTLHEVAQGSSESITDEEFEEWYRQQLNYTQYSDKQFRDLVKRSLMQQRMAQLLADNTPDITEQVHLSAIIVKTYDEALIVKERCDNGEEFASLAREVSLDTGTSENGGDIGWWPIEVLESRFQYAVSGLDIGVCSEPIINNTGTESGDTNTQDYAVFMITEKDVAREVQADHLEILKAKAYQDWLYQQWDNKEIKYYSIHGGNYDDTTHAWLTYQLKRLREGISSNSSE